jgi:hypothetical protein
MNALVSNVTKESRQSTFNQGCRRDLSGYREQQRLANPSDNSFGPLGRELALQQAADGFLE